jgi:hypothetical protein
MIGTNQNEEHRKEESIATCSVFGTDSYFATLPPFGRFTLFENILFKQ